VDSDQIQTEKEVVTWLIEHIVKASPLKKHTSKFIATCDCRNSVLVEYNRSERRYRSDVCDVANTIENIVHDFSPVEVKRGIPLGFYLKCPSCGANLYFMKEDLIPLGMGSYFVATTADIANELKELFGNNTQTEKVTYIS